MYSEPKEELLWHFRRVNQFAYAMLINKALWASKPIYFNDPFDCQRDPKYLFSHLESINPSLRNNSHYVVAKKSVERIHDNSMYAYVCFCKAWKETLMWSHYADYHRGIAFGFNEDSSFVEVPHGILSPVGYKNNALGDAIDAFLTEGDRLDAKGIHIRVDAEEVLKYHSLWDEVFNIFRFTKAECWFYESEYRLEVELAGQNRVEEKRGIEVPFSASDLNAIIFGLKCSDQDQITLINLIEAQGYPDITFYKAKKNDIEQEIEMEVISVEKFKKYYLNKYSDNNFPDIEPFYL